MHRLVIISTMLFVLLFNNAYAQVYITHEVLRSAEGTVKVRVLEEKSASPIPFASVYLTAKNDTLITNFTLTDTTGLATLSKVARGTYTLTVEMLGYKSYRQEHYFSKEVDNLGEIRLPEDIELLDAARVTAIGNPVEVKQDTIIFNASSFQMGQNQMLEDLLRRMPGMEVSADGSVKYNGEAIQKITVGGKTFFFDDPKMALRNLPARIVDKVKVIDKASDNEQFTGVATKREKVMDLEFKQEFKQGWFGNVKASTGTTLEGKDKNPLNDDRGLLYSDNVLASGYNEKDQITLIGNAYNASLMGNGDASISVAYDDDDGNTISTAGGGGLLSDAQFGVNYNTTRIKGLESTGMALYDHSFRDSRIQSVRTTFRTEGADIHSREESFLFDRKDILKVGLELKNTNRKKYLFQFTPKLRMDWTRSDETSESNTSFNKASSARSGDSRQLRQEADLSLGLRNLGNSRRNLTFRGSYTFSNFDSDSRDSSVTQFSEVVAPLIRDIKYEALNSNFNGSATLTYVEPLSKLWVLSTSVSGTWTRRDNRKDASDARTGQRDDNYSTAMQSRYDYYTANMRFQYRKGNTTLQIGARGQETYQETRSLSRGIETITGKDEWLFDWSPYLNYRFFKGQFSISASYSGSTIRPSAPNLLPTLDISVPTRLRTGNLWLKPSNRHLISFDVSHSRPEKQVSFSIMNNARLLTRQIVMASWFDEKGIQYSLPVNARKPGFEVVSNLSFSVPVSPNKRLTLSGNAFFLLGRSISYQNVRRIEGIPTDNFDYAAFMADFWGDSQGSRFYSGDSGFSESQTRTLNILPSLSLLYRGDYASFGGSGSVSYSGSRYSLDPTADTDTWSNKIGAFVSGNLPRGFEMSTSIYHYFFHGFPEGFNEPYTNWNFSLLKNIKQFVIELHIRDILNSTRSTSHIATANYIEDIQRNQLGRYFFVSFKWNFGKLNESRNAKSRQAIMNML